MPAKPRMPEPNSRMLEGSGVGGPQSGPPQQQKPLMVNASPLKPHAEPPPGTIPPTSKSQVAGPLKKSQPLLVLPSLVVAFVRVSQDVPPFVNDPVAVKVDS